MAGVCQGDPNNVTVDGSGYLHLKISLTSGVWSAAELFTTDKLAFGTYQFEGGSASDHRSIKLRPGPR